MQLTKSNTIKIKCGFDKSKMITIHYLFKCPYTNDLFEDYDDCMEHIDNHIRLDVLQPEICDVFSYMCEYCEKEYKEKLKAIKCELTHIEKGDKHYTDFEMQKLIKASNHPSQKKLVD